MSGYERHLLYRFAAETGLRANEIRSLTVRGFDFDQLRVTVKAGHSKHRREDSLPLRADTAQFLKEFFAAKLPTAKAFGGTYKRLTKRTADMLEADLAATEEKDQNGKTIKDAIPYIDEAGRYADFHSLRHTTGSLLAASGVHPKIAQSLMRHSDISLTMSKYTHTLTGQEAKAVESLPDLSLPPIQSQQAQATGTYDGASMGVGRELTPKVTPDVTPAAFPGNDRLAAIGTMREKTTADQVNRNSILGGHLGTDRHRLAAVGTGGKEVGRTGVEPATHGFSVRCSTN